MKSKTAKVGMALVICPLAMLGLSMMLPKRYTATMSLMLDPSPRIISPNDPNGVITEIATKSRARSIETEIDKIAGSEVLLGAIRLTSDQHPKVFADGDRASGNYASLVNRLRIDNNRNSDVVDIRVTMDDPAVAADTANNIGKAYQEYNARISADGGTAVLMRLDQQIEEKEKELADLDGKIAAIKNKYGIVDLGVSGGMDEKLTKDLEAQIAQMQAMYNGAQGELAAAEAELSRTEKYLRTNVNTQINPVAMDLDQKITQTASDLEAMRAKFTDSSPQVRQYADKLAQLRAERARTPDKVEGSSSVSLNPNYSSTVAAVAAARSKVNSTGGSLGALQAKLSEAKGSSSKYPEIEKQLSTLTLKKQTAQLAYQGLIAQRSPIKTNNNNAREAQAQIVSLAMPPGTPSFPNPKVFVLMGLAVGIIISALIVMPKAPDVLYAPTASETLALDGTSIRTTATALPTTTTPEPEPARPAIESENPS